jgi:hypothetical protein
MDMGTSVHNKIDTEDRKETFGGRTRNPSWNAAEFKSCKEWLLKEVQITGFSPMEQQITLNKGCDAASFQLANHCTKRSPALCVLSGDRCTFLGDVKDYHQQNKCSRRGRVRRTQ